MESGAPLPLNRACATLIVTRSGAHFLVGAQLLQKLGTPVISQDKGKFGLELSGLGPHTTQGLHPHPQGCVETPFVGGRTLS